jgi:hypothetical protein
MRTVTSTCKGLFSLILILTHASTNAHTGTGTRTRTGGSARMHILVKLHVHGLRTKVMYIRLQWF